MLSGMLLLIAALGLSVDVFQPHADSYVWLEQLRSWLLAVERHEPGTFDEPAKTVATWGRAELQTVWLDAVALLSHVACREAHDKCQFTVTLPDGKASEWRRLNDREDALFESLVRDAVHQGVNHLAKRAAIFHADIAMSGAVDSGPQSLQTWSPPPPPPPQSVRPLVSGTLMPTAPMQPAIVPSPFVLRFDDGRQKSVAVARIHWEIGRSVLDLVRPTPSQDETVRLWYHASAMYLQREVQLDLSHLEQAKRIFPDDQVILFLLGCLHETYAADEVQNVIKSAVLPTGMTAIVKSARSELGQAEAYFRHAIETKPAFLEARLRRGRVLALQGRHTDALRELRLAAAADDPLIVYYGQLFTGFSEEALGHLDLARAAYEQAAARFPNAQSPYLALSHLAQREGDRQAALRALQRAFQPAHNDVERNDPWWQYYRAQGRDAEKLLNELYAPFRTGNRP
jgi:hypothetical protein